MNSRFAMLAVLAVAACEGGSRSREEAQSTQDLAVSTAPMDAGSPRQTGSRGGGGGGGIGGVGVSGGASRGSVRSSAPSRVPPPAPATDAPDQQIPAAEPQSSLIIRTGNVSVEVDSLELAIAQVTQLATRLGGHVANSSTETGRRDHRVAQMVLRIPAQQFDAAIGGLSPIGKIESQNVGSEDVTEQFVDMTARMTNAKRLEERLINLLANRTGKLEEVLAVERELARVREEIERYEGRLRYLRTRAAISTLSIHLHEPFPIIGAPRGSNVIVEAFKRAWRNFVYFLASTISALGVLIPLAILLLGFLWILRRFGLLPNFPPRRHPPEDPPEPRADPLPPR